jgi:tetratricopeptide (TPR) repeat protein
VHSLVSNRGFIICAAVLAFFVASAMSTHHLRGSDRGESSIAPPTSASASAGFVGSKTCATCHAAQFQRWQGSHHQLAMQAATDASVLGNFSNAQFSSGGVNSTFFRRGKKFFVRTDGPGGAMHDYEIGFTFGLFPLQQYLIAMPGGRLQALGIAWDARSRETGGQRWFHLYPSGRQSASSSLHWTAIDQTWNYMCADCHSTNVRKNYNAKTRAYDTTYAEINVACEACHGPGSNHNAWARKSEAQKKLDGNKGLTIALDERHEVNWSIDPASQSPRRSRPRETDRELQMCARCHSRRSQIHEDYVHGQPVEDDYRIALLEPSLYFPDGQIKGEVYEYGSFIQSRMFHQGVTCSDCHDPHSSKPRAEGNRVCLQCHLSQKYDSPSHHFHEVGTRAAQCVECHMPNRTYMIVDARRDHSIRVPRPDLTTKLGVPSACNQCHNDKTPQWASDALSRWYAHAPSGFQHYAETIADGWEQAPGAAQELDALIGDKNQSAIARATALTILSSFAPLPGSRAVNEGYTDASSLVRRAAARGLSSSDLRENIQIPSALLGDLVRGVRIEAAEGLAGRSSGELPSVSTALEHATNEYIAAQELNADRPEAHLNLALLFAGKGQIDRAEAELQRAISIDPGFAPAAVNLADLYRERDREAEGEALLSTALRHSPNDASLLNALGLLMVRQKKNTRALELLGAAAHSDPASARYAYVYAVALHDSGRTSDALNVLEDSIKSHPYDRDTLAALADCWNKAGDHSRALSYAQRLNHLDAKMDR